MLSIKDIQEKCINLSGFTLNINTMATPINGYCVAYKETQNIIATSLGIKAVLKHAKANAGYIGGWLDEKTGIYYLDSVKIFSDKQKAIRFAIENEQIAIYNLQNGEEIRL